MRSFLLGLVLLSSSCLVLLNGCGPAPAQRSDQPSKSVASRSAGELARRLAAQELRCPYGLGECLHAAQSCYQGDRALSKCAQGFASCKAQDIAPACALDHVDNLALQEALDCWVALDESARAGQDAQSCLGGLELCLEEAQRKGEEKSPGECGPDSCVPGPQWPSDQEDWPGNEPEDPDDTGG